MPNYPQISDSTSFKMLGPDGPLAEWVAGYVARPTQQEMAAAIEAAISDCGTLVVESGTGTGKTLAYLVPALLSKKKILISTGTRHLQDQLYQRELPLACRVLEQPVSTALLKGRSNYLCLHRLDRTALEARFDSKTQSHFFQLIQNWSGRTTSGDISEVEEVPEDDLLWAKVTSTPENCLGSRCEQFNDCFVVKARRTAMDADILVVNHHLFFADMALKEEGFGQLLPGVEVVIFDEAHQLPDIATGFFSLTVSHNQIRALARDTVVEDIKENSGVKGLRESAEKLEKASADLRISMGDRLSRLSLATSNLGVRYQECMQHFRDCLNALCDGLEPAAAKGPGLASCYRRVVELIDKLDMICEHRTENHVAWLEITKRGFIYRLTPLNVADAFQQTMQSSPRAWVFTSATLSVKGRFEHFLEPLGLEEAETACWDSPYDYPNQALLYMPVNMPLPSSNNYTEEVINAAIPLVEASRGRVFMLFTSHRALQQAAKIVPERVSYPVLIQGSAPRSQLLRQFRQMGNAVLLGTGSFWEGVDMRGDVLSVVMIDKLPFAAPDDPVLQAQSRRHEESGRNPFMTLHVPSAVITLKQGAGRLIRDEADRGVLMICDPRLLGKSYGKLFLESLPPMRRTGELDEARNFFSDAPETCV